MDLNDYWQENKRFVSTVVVGLVVFLVARQALASRLGGEVDRERARIVHLGNDAASVQHTTADLTEAQTENESLRKAASSLIGDLRFVPRPDFAIDPAGGSASSQYLRTLSRVRDDLLLRANRGNLVLDESLGMPKLSPTRDEEIVRYVEALDAIDTVVRKAIDAGVAGIDHIQIRLDPGLSDRAGLGRIERTKLSFEMRGESRALTSVLTATQRDTRVLPIEEVNVAPSRAKSDEVRMDLTLILPRIAAEPGDAEPEGPQG